MILFLPLTHPTYDNTLTFKLCEAEDILQTPLKVVRTFPN